MDEFDLQTISRVTERVIFVKSKRKISNSMPCFRADFQNNQNANDTETGQSSTLTVITSFVWDFVNKNRRKSH